MKTLKSWPSDTFLNGPLLSRKTDLKVGESWSYPRNTMVEIGGKMVKVHYTETSTLKSVKENLASIESTASELWVPGEKPDAWKQISLKVKGTFSLDLKKQAWVSLERSFECEIEKGKPIARSEKARPIE